MQQIQNNNSNSALLSDHTLPICNSSDSMDEVKEDVEYLLKETEDFPEKVRTWLDDVPIAQELNSCSEIQRELLLKRCKTSSIFLIHKLFDEVENVDDIRFLHGNVEFYKANYLLDIENRNWLHEALKSNRNMEIIRFLIEELKLKPEDEDLYGYSAYHFVCQKENYIPEELEYFIKDYKPLLKKSVDERTPLELACGDPRKLNFIRRNEHIPILSLIENTDNLTIGLPDVHGPFQNTGRDLMWLAIIKRNDKSRLYKWIKSDKHFTESYYVTPEVVKSIVLKCADNGLGLLQFIRKQFLSDEMRVDEKHHLLKHHGTLEKIEKKLLKRFHHKHHSESFTKTMFEFFTDIKVIQKSDKYSYYNSALFLTLITGRLEMTQVLLRCCRFKILAFAMLTCLVCKKMAAVGRFPEETKGKIDHIRQFCEKYAIEVFNKTLNRDPTRDKKIVTTYLVKDLDILEGNNILSIAYRAKCREFLSLPTCQQAITDLWYGKVTEDSTVADENMTNLNVLNNEVHSPFIKFCLHSFFHVLFLISFSTALTDYTAATEGFTLTFCILYAFGYLFEKLRQIYLMDDHISLYFKDETNILDIGALVFMICGGMLVAFYNTIGFSQNIHTDSDAFRYAFEEHYTIRLLFCISLILFFMRLLYSASIFEKIGPKLKMISKMIVRDLLPLIFIFFIFIVSFGIVFQSMISHAHVNESDYDETYVDIIGNIFRRPAFTIFDGHYLLEEIERVAMQNVYKLTFMYFFLLVFLVVTNIMLLNLLIALFSYTVTEIIQRSKESWKAARYGYIKEYIGLTLLPPPFNMLYMLYECLCHNTTKPKEIKTDQIDPLTPTKDVKDFDFSQTATNLLSSNFSFYVIQAFAIKNIRYQLIDTEEDKEYKRTNDMKLLKAMIESESKSVKSEIRNFEESMEIRLNTILDEISALRGTSEQSI